MEPHSTVGGGETGPGSLRSRLDSPHLPGVAPGGTGGVSGSECHPLLCGMGTVLGASAPREVLAFRATCGAL